MISLSNHRALRSSSKLGVEEPTRRIIFWDCEETPRPIEYLHNLRITHVSSSGRHYAALTANGTVLTWGNGKSGQLGQNSRENLSQPTQVKMEKTVVYVCCGSAQTAAIDNEGKLFLWGWRGAESLCTPALVPSLSTKRVTQVALGAYHVMAMTEEGLRKGSVYTWGNNDKGQLGLGHLNVCEEPQLVSTLSDKFIVDICAKETSSGVVTDTGDVWVWGENVDGISLGINLAESNVWLPVQLSELQGNPISQLDFGIEFGAALSASGQVYTWGRNSQGQLGVSDRANRTVPTVVQSLKDQRVIGISCGNRHMVAWTESGHVYSWGNNNRNQLGHSGLDDVPFICQPKRMATIPASAVIYDVSCGNGSLALVDIAKVKAVFHEQVHEEEVEQDSRVVADLKSTLAPLWKFDPSQMVFQDAGGQLVSQNETLRQIVLLGKSPLTLLQKDSVTIPDTDDLKFVFDASDLPYVKAGSPTQLIRWLINPRYPNDDYLRDFLLTYRAFVSPLVLLDGLIQAYQNPQDSSDGKDAEGTLANLRRQRVIEVIRCWLLEHKRDFFNSNEESTQLLTNLHRFIDHVIAPQDRELSIELTRLYHQLSRVRPDTALEYAPESCKRAHSGEINFNSYPTLEVARQLSLVAFELFSAIECKELIGLGWMKPDKHLRAPNVLKMIHYSNKVSNWVSDTILSQSSTKRKIRTYERFVTVCKHCMDLNNYNSLMEIIGGLQSTAVFKAAKAWPNFLTGNPHVETVERITKMMIARNKAGLREKIRTAEPPGVPFLGMFLSDLLFIDDGNKDSVDGLINFRKCSLVAGTVKQIQRFQRTPYQLHPVPELKDYLLLEDASLSKSVSVSSEPAEAQLAFLNNTSSVLVDRDKQFDLQGERAGMWMKWCEMIDGEQVLFYREDGSTRGFLDILLESYALENTIYSILMMYPTNKFELNILRRLLELALIPELDIDALLDLLSIGKNLALPPELQWTMAQAVSTFKNILPSAAKYPSVSRHEEWQHEDDLADLYEKRKNANRLAVKLCGVATVMATSQERMNVFGLLYRNLNSQNLVNLQHFINVQRELMTKEMNELTQKQSEIMTKTEANPKNLEIRSLEQQRRQIIQSMDAMKKQLESLEHEQEYFRSMAEKNQADKKKYYEELDQSIAGIKAKLDRLESVESMFLHFLSLVESRDTGNQVDRECVKNDMTRSLENLIIYFENQVKSLSMLSHKLETIHRDIEVMGARYGSAVANALKHDYEQTKNAFGLSLTHLDFSVDTLHSLHNQAEQLSESGSADPDLDALLKKATTLKDSVIVNRDQIVEKHLPVK